MQEGWQKYIHEKRLYSMSVGKSWTWLKVLLPTESSGEEDMIK
jgi:hypothetical protein